MIDENKIREEFAKEIIDTILDKAEDLNFAWHYGEESLLVTDIVNLINNVAKTDYKRYGHGNMEEEWNPYHRDKKCYQCAKLFSRFPKKEHREHCMGTDDASYCEDYEILDFFK